MKTTVLQFNVKLRLSGISHVKHWEFFILRMASAVLVETDNSNIRRDVSKS